MTSYVTGGTIKRLREKQGLTQLQLAEKLNVSDKAVSRWETGKGMPDVMLLEPIASTLGVSLSELLSGECVINRNVSANMLRSKFYVCPLCGNIIHTMGEASISCCGITLPVLEADEADEKHILEIDIVEDEYHVHTDHPMTKSHFISFIAYVTSDMIEIKKLYPEGNAEARFFIRGDGMLYSYCNKDGLFKQKISRKKK